MTHTKIVKFRNPQVFHIKVWKTLVEGCDYLLITTAKPWYLRWTDRAKDLKDKSGQLTKIISF